MSLHHKIVSVRFNHCTFTLCSSMGLGKQRRHSYVSGDRMVLCNAIPANHGRQRHRRCPGHQSVFAAASRRRGSRDKRS